MRSITTLAIVASLAMLTADSVQAQDGWSSHSSFGRQAPSWSSGRGYSSIDRGYAGHSPYGYDSRNTDCDIRSRYLSDRYVPQRGYGYSSYDTDRWNSRTLTGHGSYGGYSGYAPRTDFRRSSPYSRGYGINSYGGCVARGRGY